jgi:hypothetical protein
MRENLHMQTATWLVSRELTEAAGPWDNRLSLDDDGEYFCRVICASESVRFVPAAKVFYRSAGFNRLSTIDRSDKKLESQFLSIKIQIEHVLALDNSDETRAACVKFLQIWLFCFYDYRKDLASELQQLAFRLGGRLEVPQVRKKYRWIQQLAGRRAARRAQDLLPEAKWRCLGFWDFVLSGFEKRLFGAQQTSEKTEWAS